MKWLRDHERIRPRCCGCIPPRSDNEYGDEMRAAVRAATARSRPDRRRARPRGWSPIGEVAGQRGARSTSTSFRQDLWLHAAACCGDARLRDHRHPHRRARHRRDDGGVLGHRLRADPAAAVSRARTPRQGVWRTTPGYSRHGAVARRTTATGRRRRRRSSRSASITATADHDDRRRRAAPAQPARRSAPICFRRSASPRSSAGRSPTRTIGGARRDAHSQLPPLADRVRRRSERRRAAARCTFDDAPFTVHRRDAARVPLSRQSDVAVLDADPLQRARLPGVGAHEQLAGSGRAAPARRDARAGAGRDAGDRRAVAAGSIRRRTSDTRRARCSARRRKCRSDRALLLLALSARPACVLLIACANLANLLLARALEPSPRAGGARPRSAPDASGSIRQLMTESLLLAGVGGALGIARRRRLGAAAGAARAGDAADRRDAVGRPPRAARRGRADGAHRHRFRPGAGRCASARQSGSRRPARGARSGGGQKERLRSALVVAEIIASVVLLVSAGLLIRALLTVQAIDPGFNAEGVLTLRTELPMPEYGRVVTREAYCARARQDVTRAARRASGRLHQLPADVVVPRRHLAGFGQGRRRRGHGHPQRRQRGRDPLRHARLLRDDGHSAQAGARHRRRRHPRSASSSRSSASRSSSATGRTRIRSAATSRFASPTARSSASPATCCFAGSSAMSEPQVYLSSQAGDRRRDHVLLAEGAGGSDERSPPSAWRRRFATIIRRADPKLPITEMQTLDRHGRSRDRVARRAGRACSARSRRSRSCWPRSASTGSCRSRCRSACRRSASGSRSARSRATSCR